MEIIIIWTVIIKEFLYEINDHQDIRAAQYDHEYFEWRPATSIEVFAKIQVFGTFATQKVYEQKIIVTSLANSVTHQAQPHGRSLVCFEILDACMHLYTYVSMDGRSYGRMDGRTPSSKLMTTYDRWAW